MSSKVGIKNTGQYFTPSDVAEFMIGMISHRHRARVLEPCAGEGVFLDLLSRSGFQNIRAFEIDPDLPNHSSVPIERADFLFSGSRDRYDVIIGNPPYVRWKNIPKEYRERLMNDEYWKKKLNGLGDLLYAFIYLSAEKLNPDGELIFITPVFWTETTHARVIRKILSELGEIESVVKFDEMKVFREVSSAIMVFKFIRRPKTGRPVKVVKVHSRGSLDPSMLKRSSDLMASLDETDYISEGPYEAYLTPQFRNGNPWTMLPPDARPIIDAMEQTCVSSAPEVQVTGAGSRTLYLSSLLQKEDLEEFGIPSTSCTMVRFEGKPYYLPKEPGSASFGRGTEAGQGLLRPPRLGDLAEIGNGLVSGHDRAFRLAPGASLSDEEKKKLVPVAKGKNVRKYFLSGLTPYIFVNDVRSEDDLRSRYPGIFSILSEFRGALKRRYQYGAEIPWWHWVFLRNFDLITGSHEKILVPCKERIDQKGYVRFALVEGEAYTTQDVTAIVKKPWVKEDVRYLLAILNSETMLTWMKCKGLRRGGVLEFSEYPLASIPIRLINWQDEQEIRAHDDIVELTNHILKERRIEPYGQRIESLVRQLYGLKRMALAGMSLH
ncbi:MAG: N-6 DNA methylase [Thaumarchaeota archaeon]|nr:N-6 DNA methylase [Nitrososphaerota archaeon]